MGYDYDYNGNITEITQTEHTYSDHAGLDPIYPPISPNGLGGTSSLPPQTSYTVNYTYDEANQLTSATDSQTGLNYRYAYDASGNLRTMKTYLSSTATTPIHTKTLNYTDGILTGYTEDGVTTTFTTDDMGSPILMNRGGNTVAELTWGEARHLTAYETDDFSAEYIYNADGMRIQKNITVGNTTKTTKFIWGNNGLAGTITGAQKVTILYDGDGEASGFVFEDNNNSSLSGIYTYIKNLQGDVIQVIDENGSAVLSYAYDPWGVPTVTGNQTLAELNPCSYRSYYYDFETGFYYLQSRYYEAHLGRFICADDSDYISSNTLVENNLFVYCNNNPVVNFDPFGNYSVSTLKNRSFLFKVAANLGLQLQSPFPYPKYLVWINLYCVKFYISLTMGYVRNYYAGNSFILTHNSLGVSYNTSFGNGYSLSYAVSYSWSTITRSISLVYCAKNEGVYISLNVEFQVKTILLAAAVLACCIWPSISPAIYALASKSATAAATAMTIIAGIVRLRYA